MVDVHLLKFLFKAEKDQLVTHSAFWLLFHLWGDHTTGYHLLNIALHALSAFLFALLLGAVKVSSAAVLAAGWRLCREA